MKDTVSSQVRSVRIARGLSQAELAEKSRLSINTIRGIETGDDINPTLFVLRSLSDALDFNIDIYADNEIIGKQNFG